MLKMNGPASNSEQTLHTAVYAGVVNYSSVLIALHVRTHGLSCISRFVVILRQFSNEDGDRHIFKKNQLDTAQTDLGEWHRAQSKDSRCRVPILSTLVQ